MWSKDLDEKQEMVKDFVAESRELLDDVEPQIINMEEVAVNSGAIDEEILNSVFRLFHTVKGAASFLDFHTIIQVTHEAETLLDIFRRGEAVVKPEYVDLLCRTTDFIRSVLDRVEQQLDDRDSETEAQVIIKDLKQLVSSLSESSTTPNSLNSTEDVATNLGQENKAEDSDIEKPELMLNPEMTERFIEEAMELCDDAEKSLLALENAPDDAECTREVFRYLHNLKGIAGFMGYGDIEKISHIAETIMDSIRTGDKTCDGVTVTALLTLIDVLRGGVRRVQEGSAPEIPEIEQVIEFIDGIGDSAEPQSHEENPGDGRPVRETEKKDEPIGETVNKTAEEITGAQISHQNRVIRVDTDKLDKFLDLVGELVITESIIANQDISSQQLDRFEKAVMLMDKITREVQDVAMSMRMIPLTGVLRKMVRLVRDLTHKTNKQVELDIRGEDTEVDKTVIELISDPLVHLVRNAVDHGIESVDERRATGKPEAGRILIGARHAAGEVWITVEDDGAGLDREKILQKGVQNRLIKGPGKQLKDEDVWRLIFEPGLSTSEVVSDISGRGVGMDVVRKNIEKLRGKIDIYSKPGRGTKFVIRIPLTLAIIEGMVVEVGKARYTIPISSIKESFRPQAAQVTITPDNQETVLIRGGLLPVLRLHELFHVPPVSRELTDGILIIVENGAQKCCLFVDSVLGQQQIVIKRLPGYLGHIKGLSGCAIIGDGDITMILDIAELLDY